MAGHGAHLVMQGGGVRPADIGHAALAEPGEDTLVDDLAVEPGGEFGDNEGMLDAFRRNIFSFTGWGSPAGYFASYELPLAKLRDGHHSLNVQRWAEAMLRELSDEGERDRAREEEWKARHES